MSRKERQEVEKERSRAKRAEKMRKVCYSTKVERLTVWFPYALRAVFLDG